jgi:hypothetical protein
MAETAASVLMPQRSGGAYRPLFSALSLGSSGSLAVAAALTWGEAAVKRGGPTRVPPPFPVVPRTTWHGSGTTSSLRTLGMVVNEVCWACHAAIKRCRWSAAVTVVAVLRCCRATLGSRLVLGRHHGRPARHPPKSCDVLTTMQLGSMSVASVTMVCHGTKCEAASAAR